MKLRELVLVVHCWTCILTCCGTRVSKVDDKNWLNPLLELIELDYEDFCEQKAAATWEELLGETGALQRKLERDKAFGMFSRAQTQDIRESLHGGQALASDETKLWRKVKLLLEPGDTLLDTEQWIRLVTFGETALHNLRFATDYDCGANTSCTLPELYRSMATQQDEETLRKMKESWEIKLPNQTVYTEQILPLLRNASRVNKYNTVEEYWDFLSEYEGALLKARELWDQVKPLYVKLHKYVALRLKGSEAVGKPLPVYLLRSLFGDDWLNIVETLLPKKPDIYQKIHANLQLKNIGGKEAFSKAEKLIEALNFGKLESQFWSDSKFDGFCPTVLVNSCTPNSIKAFTCKDVSIGNYLEAHESVMKVKYKEIAAIHSNNSYVLREANRLSALFEAMPGVISLLALTPHALDRAGLYPIKRFNLNANHHRLVLQLLLALRDLPRLNYYLAVDEWRLKTLKETITPSVDVGGWAEFRKQFSMLLLSDNDILGDPYVLRNKPYIGKFMGLILKYNIYQSFAEELFADDDDLVQYISEQNNRLLEPMKQGYGDLWPEMVSYLLVKREYGIESTGLTDYFRLLEVYLDNQLDPNHPDEVLDYVEPTSTELPHENEIPTKEEEPPEVKSTKDNILDNLIDTGDTNAHYKQGIETSTVAALEIKNMPADNGDQKKTSPINEASYSVYWWVGIAVALAVVVILIAIIARKRHSHRKQLEKQRRENSRA